MAESDLIVRTAEPADAADIAELGARTFLAAFEADNRPEDIHAYVAEAFSRDTIERELNVPHSVFFLAVHGSNNLGYARLRKSKAPDCVAGPKPIELERIYIDENHQGSGVGARLMQAVIDYARNEGSGSVWLGVWERNAGARKFYESQGFVLVGTKYFMVGNDKQNDVVMSRLLD